MPSRRSEECELREGILLAVPSLRAFAISLIGHAEGADDLVQETLVRALSHLDRFERGTNMRAWLFTILRNQFYTAYRKKSREVEDPDGIIAGKLRSLPEQNGHIELSELRSALTKLSVEQREAVILVGAEGLSYEEVARICGAQLGTIKSRVNRARNRLAELLGYQDNDEIGPDPVTRAAILTDHLDDASASLR
jgi:RNA polymerase sigma-70 factor (ECF subfamily)